MHWSERSEPEIPESAYVDDALVTARIRAHNAITNSSKPPYGLAVYVHTDNPEHTEVTVHSVTLHSSLGYEYRVDPVLRDRGFRTLESIRFPATIYFRFRPKGETWAALYTEENLKFHPRDGEIIVVEIDIEVHREDHSVRQIVEWEYEPVKESGVFQCASV